MPTTEPSPNSSHEDEAERGRDDAVEAVSATSAAEPASPCIMPTDEAALPACRRVTWAWRLRAMVGHVARMAVGMEMRLAGPMAVDMEMDAFAHHPVDGAPAQQHQHDADDEFEPVRQPSSSDELQGIDGTAEGASVSAWPRPQTAPCRTMRRRPLLSAAIEATAAIWSASSACCRPSRNPKMIQVSMGPAIPPIWQAARNVCGARRLKASLPEFAAISAWPATCWCPAD